MTTTALLLAILAVCQVMLPEFFYIRYGRDTLWETIIRYAEHDSVPVKQFFKDINGQTFGAVPKRDVLMCYVSFGLDVVEVYMVIALIALSAAFLLAAHGLAIWVIAVLVAWFIAEWEYRRHIKKIRWSVYSARKRMKLKVPLLAAGVVAIVLSIVLSS